MRRKMTAGALMTLAFLIPAAPVMAQAEPAAPSKACQTVERKVYKDIRELVTIDLDTANDAEVRVLGYRILEAANAESLPVLPGALEDRLKGTEGDLRAFLKADMQKAWSLALRVVVTRTLTDAGANVEAAAKKVLASGTIAAYLAYLNDGLYAERALDCASQPTPSVTPSATTTVAPKPSSSASIGASGTSSASPSAPGTSSASPSATDGGEGGGLPVTGASTGAVAGIGGALLLLGGAGYLIGRRRRSRFVA
ncbi:LPXTG cell wall anchor domain-containing protein [Actinoplanes sp. NEAU-A12]|uniref:LPXTG cell wall anchor domain-containing protein n=1 Tax=Actinoplanes sandaracinus TaxID=3045177 RepID=A0ABT6WLF6_9ACTN|nr:LPXTG cell wall anchor domain-containing protein [Actinoplanes sandaracinus]MDI6100566.1 LPXTG cell wall anchor domain-containing protein [Actinoplanes sandaracinus]